MVSVEQYEIVRELVDDAVANGATLHCGGPTEVPGLQRPLLRARRAHRRDPRHADHARGDLRAGGADRHRATPRRRRSSSPTTPSSASAPRSGRSTASAPRASRRRLETGMVWLNDHMYSHGACQCAWGGVKHSGLGRAHSKFGFYECVNVKQMVWEPSRTRDFWWHPYDASLGRAMQAAAKLLYGRDADKWAALRAGACATRQAGGEDAAPRRGREYAVGRGGSSWRRQLLTANCQPVPTLPPMPARPTPAKNASVSSAGASATSPACRACSTRPSTSPA